MPKQIEVTVVFRFEKEKGRGEQYYQNKAFDEIYNSDDVLQSENFIVEEK